MKRTIVYMLLLLTALFSCQKNEDNTTGEIVFYTNAQAMLNCGPFDVVVYMNGDSIGAISESYVEDTRPATLEGIPGTLILNKEPGRYLYSAKFSCGQTIGTWDGELQTDRDGPLYIFLDIDKCNIQTDQSAYSGPVTGYIVGSFICDEEDGETGKVTGMRTDRAYCILLEDSGNANSEYPMDFYTFDLPDNQYAFPDELLSPNYDGSNCGPHFFPDSLKYVYKISFKFQKNDSVQFVCGPCTAMELSFPWQDFDQILVRNVSKE